MKKYLIIFVSLVFPSHAFLWSGVIQEFRDGMANIQQSIDQMVGFSPASPRLAMSENEASVTITATLPDIDEIKAGINDDFLFVTLYETTKKETKKVGSLHIDEQYVRLQTHHQIQQEKQKKDEEAQKIQFYSSAQIGYMLPAAVYFEDKEIKICYDEDTLRITLPKVKRKITPIKVHMNKKKKK